MSRNGTHQRTVKPVFDVSRYPPADTYSLPEGGTAQAGYASAAERRAQRGIQSEAHLQLPSLLACLAFKRAKRNLPAAPFRAAEPL